MSNYHFLITNAIDIDEKRALKVCRQQILSL